MTIRIDISKYYGEYTFREVLNKSFSFIQRGKYVWDPTTKLWYNSNTKLYYNENTKLYCKNPSGPFYMYSLKTHKLSII